MIDINETLVCLITLIEWQKDLLDCVKSSTIQCAFLHIFISLPKYVELLKGFVDGSEIHVNLYKQVYLIIEANNTHICLSCD